MLKKERQPSLFYPPSPSPALSRPLSLFNSLSHSPLGPYLAHLRPLSPSLALSLFSRPPVLLVLSHLLPPSPALSHPFTPFLTPPASYLALSRFFTPSLTPFAPYSRPSNPHSPSLSPSTRRTLSGDSAANHRAGHPAKAVLVSLIAVYVRDQPRNMINQNT